MPKPYTVKELEVVRQAIECGGDTYTTLYRHTVDRLLATIDAFRKEARHD